MMDIAFSGERAVQDELTRESEGDILTILISYCIMFAYIALGNYLWNCKLSVHIYTTYFFCIFIIITVSKVLLVVLYMIRLW